MADRKGEGGRKEGRRSERREIEKKERERVPEVGREWRRQHTGRSRCAVCCATRSESVTIRTLRPPPSSPQSDIGPDSCSTPGDAAPGGAVAAEPQLLGYTLLQKDVASGLISNREPAQRGEPDGSTPVANGEQGRAWQKTAQGRHQMERGAAAAAAAAQAEHGQMSTGKTKAAEEAGKQDAATASDRAERDTVPSDRRSISFLAWPCPRSWPHQTPPCPCPPPGPASVSPPACTQGAQHASIGVAAALRAPPGLETPENTRERTAAGETPRPPGCAAGSAAARTRPRAMPSRMKAQQLHSAPDEKS